jgi:hypothetical protein
MDNGRLTTALVSNKTTRQRLNEKTLQFVGKDRSFKQGIFQILFARPRLDAITEKRLSMFTTDIASATNAGFVSRREHSIV